MGCFAGKFSLLHYKSTIIFDCIPLDSSGCGSNGAVASEAGSSRSSKLLDCQTLAVTGPACAESLSGAAAGPSAPPEDEGVDPVDPEFLAALPEELQQEVLESRRREIQQRRNAREREEAQRVRMASQSLRLMRHQATSDFEYLQAAHCHIPGIPTTPLGWLAGADSSGSC